MDEWMDGWRDAIGSALGIDLERCVLYVLFNHPHLVVQVASVQNLISCIVLTGLTHKFTGDKSLW